MRSAAPTGNTPQQNTPTGAGSRPPISQFTYKILDDMRKVLVDRGATYSDIEDNTTVWWRLLEALGIQNGPVVGMKHHTYCSLLYITMKLSRLAGDPEHADTWLDAANYCVLELGMQQRDQRAVKRVHDRQDTCATPPDECCFATCHEAGRCLHHHKV